MYHGQKILGPLSFAFLLAVRFGLFFGEIYGSARTIRRSAQNSEVSSADRESADVHR